MASTRTPTTATALAEGNLMYYSSIVLLVIVADAFNKPTWKSLEVTNLSRADS
jgi:hypothetical protein